jgi:hypothetical protein
MNTYVWTFSVLDTFPSYEGLNDVVMNVRYIYSASDGNEHEASISGQFYVIYNPKDKFIPFYDLSQSDIERWADEFLNVPSLQQQLDEMIQQIVTPPIMPLPPPWLSN